MANQRNTRRYTAEAAAVRVDWLQSVDADTSTVDQWDVQTETLTAAILAVLARGAKVQFSRSWDGGAVGVTVFEGEARTSKWVRDSAELDDLMGRILKGARQAKGSAT